MGNNPSSSRRSSASVTSPPVSASGVSLARIPSAASSQFSSIPEAVQASLDPAAATPDPILIRPRLASPSGNGGGGTPASPHPLSSPTYAPTRVGKGGNALDIDDMIQRLLEVGYSGKIQKGFCLKNAEINAVCMAAREIVLEQPSLIELTPPVKVVGDIHGQFHDLLRLFEMCGYPPSSNFLFLGDYVDRGKQSLETILLLLCYKIKFPNNFFLLRGNHECANVTRVYGFYDECKRRCNVKIWKTFISVFDALPIAALVANKIFCVHGGLSPSMTHMDDIRRIQRPREIPDFGLLNDLLWSDPSENAVEWEDNERGVSYCFGRKVLSEFLARHELDLVCRAHMVVEDGYEFFGDRQLVTVFSAPNYCGEFDNYGAVMGVSEELMCSFQLLKPMDAPFGTGVKAGKLMPVSGTASNAGTEVSNGTSQANGSTVTSKLAGFAGGLKASRGSPPLQGGVPQSV